MPSFFNSYQPTLEDLAQIREFQKEIALLVKIQKQIDVLHKNVQHTLHEFVHQSTSISGQLREGLLQASPSFMGSLKDAENYQNNKLLIGGAHKALVLLDLCALALLAGPSLCDFGFWKPFSRLGGSFILIAAMLSHIHLLCSAMSSEIELSNNNLQAHAPLKFDEIFRHELMRVIITVNNHCRTSHTLPPTHDESLMHTDGQCYYNADKPHGFYAQDLSTLLEEMKTDVKQQIHLSKRLAHECHIPTQKRTLLRHANHDSPTMALLT